jgi:putrescine transport system substrate-binding protein
MGLHSKEDPELNLLMQAPGQQVGRRGFLQIGALLGVAGAAGYLGGRGATLGRHDASAAKVPSARELPSNRRDERVLNVLNWSDYVDEQTIPVYQAHSNIRVNYDVYSSSEELLAKMRAGPTDYDIIVPSSSFIPTYRQLDLIEPLRQDLIPNLGNLDREFVETDYDPGNRYTIPWQWGTTGIGYHRRRVAGAVSSWKSVFEPDAAVRGRVSLLREVTDLIACALIYLGKSPNSSKEADLAEVVSLLRSAKSKVRKFTSDTYIDELAAGETWLAQGWSGDMFQSSDRNAAIAYRIPDEGSLRFVDVMCVPKGAPHSGNAARFMNYVLQPKVQARISRYVSYGTPVSLAKPLLPAEQLSDPAIYPPSSIKLSIITVTGQQQTTWRAAFDAVVRG